ncbi:class I SAM-dependent methyltransferase [Aspergillus novofumigatus IBT 16806]|uniref:S-adenosyl-L-methionine-dependent methyltransferase n=1 Tax=Aspergillus novofumigatus (strain IBT 16806) TaxID=1392255 RepID=A0A2I1CEC2_ASPN1|nr:S-adenosyl-L-methionine-dependent methyltransferase [Aspergillus novofumigatus IBT 16806]PKX95964.1 S-adenosyl-L-methionine-dependent methyltransferase [Aspergillus novofumigatus IBT 16806]
MTIPAQYDNPAFFAKYSQLPRNSGGLTNSLEWPIISRNIGQVTNQTVLDLGCGYGQFCGWASENGAASVHGIDASANMLEKAREFNNADNITYEQGDLDLSLKHPLKLRENAYDVVHSSLAFHYPKNLAATFAAIYKALKPGGRFVFSVQHPTFSAPRTPNWGSRKDGGTPFWELESYGSEGPRTVDFLGHPLHVYHRTMETYVSLLLENGFTLVDFKECIPPAGALPEAHPDYGKEGHRPLYLILAAEKG